MRCRAMQWQSFFSLLFQLFFQRQRQCFARSSCPPPPVSLLLFSVNVCVCVCLGGLAGRRARCCCYCCFSCPSSRPPAASTTRTAEETEDAKSKTSTAAAVCNLGQRKTLFQGRGCARNVRHRRQPWRGSKVRFRVLVKGGRKKDQRSIRPRDCHTN